MYYVNLIPILVIYYVNLIPVLVIYYVDSMRIRQEFLFYFSLFDFLKNYTKRIISAEFTPTVILKWVIVYFVLFSKVIFNE